MAQTVGSTRDVAEAVAAAAAGRRIRLRHGKTTVAVVPAEDLELLEALEDQALNEVADAAIAEFEASGEAAIPWAEVKKRAGLE
jgi:hypothetical protein